MAARGPEIPGHPFRYDALVLREVFREALVARGDPLRDQARALPERPALAPGGLYALASLLHQVRIAGWNPLGDQARALAFLAARSRLGLRHALALGEVLHQARVAGGNPLPDLAGSLVDPTAMRAGHRRRVANRRERQHRNRNQQGSHDVPPCSGTTGDVSDLGLGRPT